MAVGRHCSCILVVISNVALIGVLKVPTPCRFFPPWILANFILLSSTLAGTLPHREEIAGQFVPNWVFQKAIERFRGAT